MIIKRGDGDFTKVFRPCTIDEMKGHDKIRAVIKKALDTNTLSHSYLFYGDHGTGKTTLARIIALGLNCVKGVTSSPCCECDNCKSILNDTSPDYLEINIGDKSGVGDIRDILKNLVYVPFNLRNKVIVLDECHRMSLQAKDALLKPMEDYKDSVYFILCTTEINKVPKALISRCSTFKFGKVSLKDTIELLEEVCQYEGLLYTEEVLQVIAEHSDSVRSALNLLKDVALAEKVDNLAWVQGFIGTSSVEDASSLSLLIKNIIKKNWFGARSEFSKIKSDFKPDDLRVALLNYFSASLANAKSVKSSATFFTIANQFSTPVSLHSELLLRIYKATTRG